MARLTAIFLALALSCRILPALSMPALGPERAVFLTAFGEFEVGFYSEAAPKTSRHILRLCQLGAYTGNHFFNVQPDYHVQVEGVTGGRQSPLSKGIKKLDRKRMPLEVSEELVHEAGSVSLAHGGDPDTGGSSFAILLNRAPHLDGNYTVFGQVTRGLGVLYEVEDVETEGDGPVQRPTERVPIYSTYWYTTEGDGLEARCDLE
ncbi:unnamed protein product [Ostreobium quekettii]|uniref:Peptidyl-prolyl cis-trans isomerase n=1 Tax=Ostreobium quekettii TaxID=121088 RepID=A0A8S1JEV1_9CHLO|nr:unnamed protein product [Ostreobium quekettii]|eukprot:evm.model.scf_681.2 EVM.evm.TU.scf_681.2   scf_681:6465-7079(-)